MRLERLELSGFCHFTRPAVLDLRALPDGLVAVVGPNGSGKTMFLDSSFASLYTAFASRSGPLFDYAASDGYITATWALNGRRVRTRINVDGRRRVLDAVLEEESAAGRWWSMNDGKVSTFRSSVADLFPSKETILASAFSAQNHAGSFLTLAQKDQMRLFGELIGLGDYEVKAATAKRCADVAAGVVAQLGAALDVLRRETGPDVVEALKSRWEELTQDLSLTAKDLIDAEARITQLEKTRKTLAVEAERYAAAMAQVEAVQQVVTQEQSRVAELERRLAATVSTYETSTKDRQARIANNNAIIGRAPEIRRAARTVIASDLRLSELRAQQREAQVAVEAARDVLMRCSDESATVLTAPGRLLVVKRQAEIMTSVPCHGKGKYATCQFLSDAASAQAAQPELEATVARLPGLLAAQEDAKGAVTAAREALATIDHEMGTVERDRKAAEPLAKLEGALLTTTERLSGYAREQREADQAHQAHTAQMQLDIESGRHGIAQAHAQLQLAQSEAEKNRGARTRLDETDLALDVARLAQRTAETKAATATALLKQVEAEQAKVAQRAATVAIVEIRQRQAEDEGLAWQVLARACGRDGLPKLEIDAAGPTVSALCNELLSVAYGPRFSVMVVTQTLTADGSGLKEKFAIEVLDNAHGGETRDIGDLSGGEKVVVEEALRAALSAYVNQRSQHAIGTLFRDETTGALDLENAPKYVAMLRKLRELSGASQILFVTHNPECAMLADAQIHVEAGIPTIVLPPYAEV